MKLFNTYIKLAGEGAEILAGIVCVLILVVMIPFVFIGLVKRCFK